MTNSPTQMLEEEHRFIAKAVNATAVIADKLETGEPVAIETLQDIVEFMRTYADKCHHGKEEDLLFPMLAQRGVPMRGCPVEALTHEHTMGRALVKILRGIAELYPNHIWKEDYLLFPMTNKVLSAEDQQNLAQEFDKVEESVGHDTHQRLEQLSEQLAQIS